MILGDRGQGLGNTGMWVILPRGRSDGTAVEEVVPDIVFKEVVNRVTVFVKTFVYK